MFRDWNHSCHWRLERLYRSGLLLLAFCAAGMAQQYSISTVAGATPLLGQSVTAVGASIGHPVRVTADKAGNFYFSSLNSVFKVNSAGMLTLVAGTTHAGYSGDGGPAVKAQLNSPQGLAIDSKGNLYIADSANNRIRIVSPSGVINTFAGNGQTGDALPAQPTSLPSPIYGDGGPPTSAYLHLPSGVAVDTSGNVYIADTSHNRICEVYSSLGIINTVAGDSYAGYGGDAGYPTTPAPPYPVPYQAVLAELRNPEDVAVDSTGNIYIADTGNDLIRKVTTDGNINYIAGDPTPPPTVTGPYYGDGGPAIVAGLVNPFSVAVDSTGNVYEVEADSAGARVRHDQPPRVTTRTCVQGNWCINSIAGNRPTDSAGMADPPRLHVESGLGHRRGFGRQPLHRRIRAICESARSPLRPAPTRPSARSRAAAFPAIPATADRRTKHRCHFPQGVAAGADGSVYFADANNNVVRKVAPTASSRPSRATVRRVTAATEAAVPPRN